MGASLTVLHAADFQCGSPFLPTAAEAMHRVAHDVSPDLVVVAGDLTQRAKRSEFAEARAVLDGFGDVPLVLTPGNHDVPLYRFWERLFVPFRNWRDFAGPELDTVTRLPGATVVALNSAAPRRAIVNGRIGTEQLDFAGRAFGRAPADDFRLLVVHHHFVPVPGGEGGRTLPAADRLVDRIAEIGVDALLGGHVHQLHVHVRRGVPVIAVGTATSRRGRGGESEGNSFCVHRFTEGTLEVTPWRRAPNASDFLPLEPLRFPLREREAPVS